MSHYLLKLKESWSNYLAELRDYNTPQWQPRDIAKKFATADDARTYLAALHARGLDYPARVVFLRTASDLKTERKMLRAMLENIRDVCPGTAAILARAALGEAREIHLAGQHKSNDSNKEVT